MVAEVVRTYGKLDILVNNAGLAMSAPLDTIAAETCKSIVDVNLLGCTYATLYSIPQLKRTHGSLVFISSIAGLVGLPTASVYCATKAALSGFAGSLRCELSPGGVHVGVVHVGFTENDPEKTVVGPGGLSVSPVRPAHLRQDEVAKHVADLIGARRRRLVLTPLGKLADLLVRLSPGLVEKLVAVSEHYHLPDRIGIG
jgi:short-subunit dehydrogenase